MIIGVCRMVLSIGQAYSLKEKRHIVKSITGRIKARFNASVAEVDYNDVWKSAAIGVAYVTNESSHADRMLSNIVNFVEGDGRVELVDYTTEKIYYD